MANAGDGARRWLVAPTVGLAAFMEVLDISIANLALQHIAGSLQPIAQAILADAFPPHKRGQAFAIYGLSVVFAPAIGPTLGGWITDNFSWRWVFLLNVPVGVLLSLLAARVIVDPPERVAALKTRFKGGLRFDTIGFSFLVVGMCALQVVLDKGQEDDWWSSTFITNLSLLAVVALTAFVVWELRNPHPIVDLRLLANRNFALGNILMFILGFILLSSTVLLPLYVQSVLGYTATEAGKVISPGGFAVMIMMPIVGGLVGRVDARWLLASGLVATSLALFNMHSLADYVEYAKVAG